MQNSSNFLKATVYLLMAFFSLAIFGLLLKAASSNGEKLWITFIALATSSLLLMPYVAYKGRDFLKTQKMHIHFFRALVGIGATFLYMIAISKIPIVNATLLYNTSPLFIPILAAIWMKSKTTTTTWVAIGLGFLGIIFIIKPNQLLFEQTGNWFGLAAGMSLAVAFLLVKKLSQTEPSMRIVCYFVFLSTCLIIPLLVFAGPFPGAFSCFLAMLAGCCMLSIQIFLVEGYKYGDPSEVGIYQYSTVVFVALINWMIAGDVPTYSDLLGVILVVLGAYLIIQSQQKQTFVNVEI